MTQYVIIQYILCTKPKMDNYHQVSRGCGTLKRLKKKLFNNKLIIYNYSFSLDLKYFNHN